MNVIKVLCNLGEKKLSHGIRYLEANSEANFLKCFSFQLVQSRSFQHLQFDAVCNVRARARADGDIQLFMFLAALLDRDPAARQNVM